MANHKHLVGIYSDRAMADRVLTELNQMGFGADEVSVLAKDHEDADQVKMHSATTYPAHAPTREIPVVAPMDNAYVKTGHQLEDKDPAAMKKGAATGTILGTAVGLGSLLIPGLGPILAGGAIAAAVATTSAWTAAGATVGMLIGLIKDIQIPEDRIELYKTAFEKGQFLIIVHPESDPVSRLHDARAILGRFAPKILDAY